MFFGRYDYTIDAKGRLNFPAKFRDASTEKDILRGLSRIQSSVYPEVIMSAIYTIDAKGRLNFPAKFRDAMGESFVVLEWVDSCLFALPMEEVQRLADKLESDELMDSWAISGDLFSTACEVVPDKQGRILLPAELRAYAGLEKDVTIIGNRNHAEIWATEVWNARRAAVTNDQRAERLRKLHL